MTAAEATNETFTPIQVTGGLKEALVTGSFNVGDFITLNTGSAAVAGCYVNNIKCVTGAHATLGVAQVFTWTAQVLTLSSGTAGISNIRVLYN